MLVLLLYCISCETQFFSAYYCKNVTPVQFFFHEMCTSFGVTATFFGPLCRSIELFWDTNRHVQGFLTFPFLSLSCLCFCIVSVTFHTRARMRFCKMAVIGPKGHMHLLREICLHFSKIPWEKQVKNTVDWEQVVVRILCDLNSMQTKFYNWKKACCPCP